MATMATNAAIIIFFLDIMVSSHADTIVYNLLSILH
jgi:hypothetical protein